MTGSQKRFHTNRNSCFLDYDIYSLQGIGARPVEVMKDQLGDAEIHQSESNGAPGAAGADLHHCLGLGAVRSQDFEKTVAPAAAIEIVSGGAAIRRDRHCVDSADLRRLRVDRVE